MGVSERLVLQPPSVRPCLPTSVQRALKASCVEFIDENGGGPGVRLRKPQQRKQFE